jgi:hypothetical protein
VIRLVDHVVERAPRRADAQRHHEHRQRDDCGVSRAAP